MNIDRAVLFVVDVQNGFCNEFSAPAVRRILRLVRHWSDAGLPMIFTKYHNYPGSKFERLLDWTEVQHAPDTDLVTALTPFVSRAVAVVDKTGYSVFTTQVAKIVDEHGWTDLVFCGLDTDTCVLKSVADAFEREHTPWLVRDACASHGSRGQHRAGVTMAGRFIGQRQLITPPAGRRRPGGGTRRPSEGVLPMTTARDIMTPDVTCVGAKETTLDAARKMADLGVGSLPICGEDQRLKGMLTDRDIVVKVLAEGRDPATVTAGELAQGEAITIGADDDAAEILQTMASHQVRRLPVIDGHSLVGIVAVADVARALPDRPVGDLIDAISS